ncbi:MAG: hypothetical protein M0C28_16250 [Candidatus Moduliflexus flocculans]|nr:hypothetical protein [Candidatus Moduliflexus flocculans]
MGLLATAGIIVVGAVFVASRDRGGVAVDAQPAARKAVFRSSVTASGRSWPSDTRTSGPA